MNCLLRFRRSRASSHTDQAAGFTLLELLIVTGLLALLTAISWPSIRRAMSRADHERAVDQVVEVLSDTRSRSVSDGRPRLVQLDPMGRRLDVYEVAYDEVGPSYFMADRRQGGPATTPPASTSEVAPARETNLSDASPESATLADSQSPMGRNSTPLPAGVAWRHRQTLKLPEGVWCRFLPATQTFALERSGRPGMQTNNRLADVRLPNTEPQRIEARDANPAQTSSRLVPEQSLRVFFGVKGRTADFGLLVLNVSGLKTTVSIDGALGLIHKGDTRRQTTDERRREVEPLAEEEVER